MERIVSRRGIDNVAEYTPKYQEKEHAHKESKCTPRFNPNTLRSKKENLISSIAASKGTGDVQSKVMEFLALPYELDVRDYTKVLQSCNSIQPVSYTHLTLPTILRV